MMIDKGNKDANNKEHPINIYKSAFDRLKTIPRSRNQNKDRNKYWKSHKSKVKIVTNTSEGVVDQNLTILKPLANWCQIEH